MRRLALLVCLASAAAAAPASATRSGLGRFDLEQVPLALGWHGTAAVLYFQPRGLGPGAAVYAAGAAAGYVGTVLLARSLPVSPAQAHMATDFAYRGMLAGHSFNSWLRQESRPGRVLDMWVGSVAGEAGGYLLARRMDLGRAAMVTTANDIGVLDGLCLAGILNDFAFHNSLWYTAPSGGILPGSVAGALVGVIATRGRRITEGQATVVRTGSYVGFAVPAAACYAITGRADLRSQSWMAGLALVGNAAGAWLAARAVRARPLETASGYAAAAVSGAGAAAGAGLGYLVTRSPRGAAGLGAAGAAAGFAAGLCLAQRPGWGRLGAGRIELDGPGLAAAIAGFVTARRFRLPEAVRVRF